MWCNGNTTALGAVVAVQVRHLLPFNHIKPELTGYDWPVEVRRHVRCGLVEALNMRLVGDDSRGAQL